MMVKLYHSEEAAKSNWCPHTGRQRFERQDERCLGSECMAWRWAETWQPDENGDLNNLRGDVVGFCGLSGVPKISEVT